jgi:hypothetical protein
VTCSNLQACCPEQYQSRLDFSLHVVNGLLYFWDIAEAEAVKKSTISQELDELKLAGHSCASHEKALLVECPKECERYTAEWSQHTQTLNYKIPY